MNDHPMTAATIPTQETELRWPADVGDMEVGTDVGENGDGAIAAQACWHVVYAHEPFRPPDSAMAACVNSAL